MKEKIRNVREGLKRVEEQLKKITPGNFSHTVNNQIHVLYYYGLSLEKVEKELEKGNNE